MLAPTNYDVAEFAGKGSVLTNILEVDDELTYESMNLHLLSRYGKDAHEASKRVLRTLIITTPLKQAVDQIQHYISLCDSKTDPQGLRIIGGAGTGKSTVIRLLRHQLEQQDLLGKSIGKKLIYTRIGHKDTRLSQIRLGLHALGHPLGQNGRLDRRIGDVKFELLVQSMRARKIVCWIFDEAQNLFTTTRGRGVTSEAESAVTDFIRSISDRLKIPVVLIGTPALAKLEEFDVGLTSRARNSLVLPALNGTLWQTMLKGYFNLLKDYADPNPLADKPSLVKIRDHVCGEQRQLKFLFSEIAALAVDQKVKVINYEILDLAIQNLRSDGVRNMSGFSR